MPDSLGLETEGVVDGILTRLLSERPQRQVDLLDGNGPAAAVGDVRVTDLEGGKRARLTNHAHESSEALLRGEVLDGIPGELISAICVYNVIQSSANLSRGGSRVDLL